MNKKKIVEAEHCAKRKEALNVSEKKKTIADWHKCLNKEKKKRGGGGRTARRGTRYTVVKLQHPVAVLLPATFS